MSIFEAPGLRSKTLAFDHEAPGFVCVVLMSIFEATCSGSAVLGLVVIAAPGGPAKLRFVCEMLSSRWDCIL